MKNLIETFGRRTAVILLAQGRLLPFMLGLTSLFLGVGFLIGVTISPNYVYLLEFLPVKYWGIWFIAYGILKVMQAAFRTPLWLKTLNAMQGSWLWLYIFFVFAIFDKATLSPIEILLILPILGESFNLLIDMLTEKNAPCRRKGDPDVTRRP